MPEENFPQRPRSHVVGSKALDVLKNVLPDQWIVRPIQDDYGIDCEIEIVDEEGSVTGAILKCQVKGTEGTIDSVTVRTSTIKYWVGMPVPVILVLVLFPEEKVRWLHVREYLLENERLDRIYESDQKTFSFSFRDSNPLPEATEALRDLALEHSLNVLSWLEESDEALKADYIGYQILIHVFDGNPGKMLKFIREKGSESQLTDIPFVLWVKEQLHEDPTLLDRIRTMVEEDSSPGGLIHERAKELGLPKE